MTGYPEVKRPKSKVVEGHEAHARRIRKNDDAHAESECSQIVKIYEDIPTGFN